GPLLESGDHRRRHTRHAGDAVHGGEDAVLPALLDEGTGDGAVVGTGRLGPPRGHMVRIGPDEEPGEPVEAQLVEVGAGAALVEGAVESADDTLAAPLLRAGGHRGLDQHLAVLGLAVALDDRFAHSL